jgi:uncharacterized membrane protein YhaH (DUF805 family)
MALIALALLFVAGIYLLPTIIAMARDHPNTWLIGAINVMTGLTVLGWSFALREALKPLLVPSSTLSAPIQIEAQSAANGSYSNRHHHHQSQPRRSDMSFTASIKSCFANYFGFTGRARRSEYWYFQLFLGLLLLTGLLAPLLAVAVFAVLFLPALAVTIRRLHDIDKSGWHVLLIYVPVIGIVLLLIWYCREGTPGENRFGPDPFSDQSLQDPFASVSSKAEQLGKLKALFDTGTVTQAEFDKMKAEIIAS